MLLCVYEEENNEFDSGTRIRGGFNGRLTANERTRRVDHHGEGELRLDKEVPHRAAGDTTSTSARVILAVFVLTLKRHFLKSRQEILQSIWSQYSEQAHMVSTLS